MYAQCLKRPTNNYGHMKTGPSHKFSSDRLVKLEISPVHPLHHGSFYMYEVMFKQTRGKYKRNCSPRQVLAEELGYRKEIGYGGALRFAAIAFFLALFKSLHVKIPGYIAKSLGIHHHPIMTHTASGRCRRGASMFIVFWLSGQLTSHRLLCSTPFPYDICIKHAPKTFKFEYTKPQKLFQVLALA